MIVSSHSNDFGNLDFSVGNRFISANGVVIPDLESDSVLTGDIQFELIIPMGFGTTIMADAGLDLMATRRSEDDEGVHLGEEISVMSELSVDGSDEDAAVGERNVGLAELLLHHLGMCS